MHNTCIFKVVAKYFIHALCTISIYMKYYIHILINIYMRSTSFREYTIFFAFNTQNKDCYDRRKYYSLCIIFYQALYNVFSMIIINIISIFD